jgi:hypothetical protein
MPDTTDPHVLDPDHLPTPFSAAEIRDASPVGLTLRLRHEPNAGEPFERVIRFVAVDADGAERMTWRVLADGSLVDGTSSRSTWLGLQAHASMPRDATTREREVVDTPMGALDCWRYTLREGDSTVELWFALDLPGMPIRTVESMAGASQETMTMLSHEVTPGD